MDRTPVILCIDSDRTGLMIRKAVLETAHYKVLTAPDAPLALSIARSVTVDLLITEQALPSMTGVELARECKRARPQTRVLLLTCSPHYPRPLYVDEEFCKFDGPAALLSKIHGMVATPLTRVRAMAAAAA